MPVARVNHHVKIRRLKTAVVGGNFDGTLVRIATDEGIRGPGECFFAPGLTSILRSLEPLLIDEDPRGIHRLYRKLQLATSGAGSVAGVVDNAISGIEGALSDVLGQWLEAPIYRLLGGRFRDRVRVYADCHGGKAMESLDEILRSRAASWDSEGESHVARAYHGVRGEVVPASPDDDRRFIGMTENPGLGITLNEEVARRDARRGEPRRAIFCGTKGEFVLRLLPSLPGRLWKRSKRRTTDEHQREYEDAHENGKAQA
jgi:L-alanine-DL-glutamate epimerase-like enolase superfamily enzyme